MVVTALRRRRRDVQHHSGGQQSRVTYGSAGPLSFFSR